MHWPYSVGTLGIVRFILSILILFVYYYTFNLFSEPTDIKRNDFFIYPLPIAFFAYLVYDDVKNKEYGKASKKERAEMEYRLSITMLFLIISIALAIFYYSINVAKFFETYSLPESEIWRFVFLILFPNVFFIQIYQTTNQTRESKIQDVNFRHI